MMQTRNLTSNYGFIVQIYTYMSIYPWVSATVQWKDSIHVCPISLRILLIYDKPPSNGYKTI
jgi:hypothetical protein